MSVRRVEELCRPLTWDNAEMPDINIGVKVSGGGAIGQLSAIQGAIDSITGKSVKVKVEMEGGGALGRAAADFERLGGAAQKAQQHADRFGGVMMKAHSQAEKLGEHAHRTAGHVERLGGSVHSAGSQVERFGQNAADAHEHVEKLGEHSARAAAAQQQLGATAERAGAATERSTGAATRAVGTQAEAVKQVGQHVQATAAGVEDLNKGLSKTAETMGSLRGPGNAGLGMGPGETTPIKPWTPRTPEPKGGGSPWGGSAATDAKKTADGVEEIGKSAEHSSGHVISLKHALNEAQNVGWQLAAVGGAMAGVTGEAVSLGKATAGLGMNFDGMNAMLARTEAQTARGAGLGLPEMDAQLRQSARNMTRELGPAMKASVGAVQSLEQAKMGAWGSLGSEIAGFANTVSHNAPAIQSMMHSLGASALSLGGDVVAGVAQSAPAWEKLSKTIAQNSGGITDTIGSAIGGAADTLNAGANVDKAVKDTIQPGGRPGSWNQTPSWGNLAKKALTTAAFGPGIAFAEAAGGPIGRAVGGGGDSGSSAQGGFPLEQRGTRVLPPEAQWAKGMTGAQAYEHQRAAAGLGKEGAPAWDGLAGHLSSSMASKLESSSGSTGQAIENHVQKAVHQAAPAASAGGASIGGAITGGAAQGITSTQTVTDTAIIKHLKKVLDQASGPGGIDAHSPSRKYDYLGRLIPQGLAQGIEADSGHTFGAMTNMLSAQEDMASKYAPGYDGSSGVTVSVRKAATQANADDAAQQARQYGPSGSANIQAHNERAAALAVGREDLQRQAIGGMTHDERRDMLAQRRSDLHERALANLGIAGHSDPSKNSNPFAGDQHQSLWNTITNQGPMGDLKAKFAEHGEHMTQGVSVGIGRGAPAAQNRMSEFARGMQNVHRKTHGIESPSTEFFSDGLNLAAGAALGVTAGTPQSVAAVTGMSNAMQTAGGWLSDRGLMVGYSWAQNVLTGANTVIKQADYKALALPNVNSPMAKAALGQQGFLVAGSGAESYKMPDGSSGVVSLGAGTPANQTIVLQPQHIYLDGQHVATIADQRIEVAFGEVKDAVARQSR